jgi:hypothetical protein
MAAVCRLVLVAAAMAFAFSGSVVDAERASTTAVVPPRRTTTLHRQTSTTKRDRYGSTTARGGRSSETSTERRLPSFTTTTDGRRVLTMPPGFVPRTTLPVTDTADATRATPPGHTRATQLTDDAVPTGRSTTDAWVRTMTTRNDDRYGGDADQRKTTTTASGSPTREANDGATDEYERKLTPLFTTTAADTATTQATRAAPDGGDGLPDRETVAPPTRATPDAGESRVPTATAGLTRFEAILLLACFGHTDTDTHGAAPVLKPPRANTTAAITTTIQRNAAITANNNNAGTPRATALPPSLLAAETAAQQVASFAISPGATSASRRLRRHRPRQHQRRRWRRRRP